jgi:hypothetical protein
MILVALCIIDFIGANGLRGPPPPPLAQAIHSPL